MCALIVLREIFPDYPLVIGANRDESFARSFRDPEIRQVGQSRILCPIDNQAGGTWLGINSNGIFAAITNRPTKQLNSNARSRGLLVVDVLAQTLLRRAKAALAELIKREAYNPFHLFIANTQDAWLASFAKAALQWTQLPLGTHVITNEHALNEIRVPRIADETHLRTILADHTQHGKHAFCKHNQSYGTVSSSLYLLQQDFAKSKFYYADGPPCATQFRDFSHSFEQLTN